MPWQANNMSSTSSFSVTWTAHQSWCDEATYAQLKAHAQLHSAVYVWNGFFYDCEIRHSGMSCCTQKPIWMDAIQNHLSWVMYCILYEEQQWVSLHVSFPYCMCCPEGCIKDLLSSHLILPHVLHGVLLEPLGLSANKQQLWSLISFVHVPGLKTGLWLPCSVKWWLTCITKSMLVTQAPHDEMDKQSPYLGPAWTWCNVQRLKRFTHLGSAWYRVFQSKGALIGRWHSHVRF